MPPRFPAHAETVKISGRRMLGWQTLAWTCFAALLLFGLGLHNHSLWDYHEPYVGGIIREMADSGDWVVPTLNGQPYLEKPPLFYALGALACRAFGSYAPWVLRLPSAGLALATVAWVCYLGWRLSSARAGGWAGFMVATSVLFFTVGHEAVVDMTLTAAVTFGLGFAVLAMVEPPYRARWTAGFWASLGFAFLAKGLPGPVLVLVPVVVMLGMRGDPELRRAFLRPSWGMAAGLLLVAGWVVPLALRGGREFLTEAFVRNTLGRFLAAPGLVPRTGRLGEHVEPFTFYLQRTPGNLLPWVALWGAALWASRPKRGRQGLSARSVFLPLAFAVDLLLLSLSAEKRMVYILPILPITLLHAAIWLDTQVPRRRARAQRSLRWVLGPTLAFVGLLGAGFPWVAAARAGLAWPAALALSLLSLGLSAITVVLLLQRRFPVVVDWTMAQWTLFLLTFLLAGVPAWDRQWRPLTGPFESARLLEGRGAKVYEGRLTETQLGYASLALRHVLPSLPDAEAIRRALETSGPVAILVESRHFWRDTLEGRVSGRELPTEAARSPRLRDRAPVLLVNEAAWGLAKDR